MQKHIKLLLSLITKLLIGSGIAFAYFLTTDYDSMFSNYTDVSVNAKNKEQEMILIPLEYKHWFYFKNATLSNYGKIIVVYKDSFLLKDVAPFNFILMTKSKYYVLTRDKITNSFLLEELKDTPVNPIYYLLKYISIFLLLIIFSSVLCFLIDILLLKMTLRNSFKLLFVSILILSIIFWKLFLYDWMKLLLSWYKLIL